MLGSILQIKKENQNHKIMKRILILIGLVLSTIISIPAQAENKKQNSLAETLINYEKQTWKLAKRKDLKAFAEFIAEDFIGVYPDAENVTKNELLKSLGSIDLKDFELTDFKTAMLNKDAYIITYKATSRIVADEKEISASVNVLAGWARRDDKWQIVFFRESSLK